MSPCNVGELFLTFFLANLIFTGLYTTKIWKLIDEKFFRGNLYLYFNDVDRPYRIQTPVLALIPFPIQIIWMFVKRRKIIDYIATNKNQRVWYDD